jgi:hypothetical protein
VAATATAAAAKHIYPKPWLKRDVEGGYDEFLAQRN